MSKIDFLTPVGRLVTGDLFTPNKTDMQGQPLTVKSGPNKGQLTQQYIAGLAFAKADPLFAAFYDAKIDTPARAAWPQWFNGPIGPNGKPSCTHPAMSLKIRDGDGIDGMGKPNSTKEGYAGHWVLIASSSFAPRVFHVGQYQEHQQIRDPKIVRRGYFGRIGGTIESNNNPQKPGLYVNLNMFDLCGQGPEITSGPDAAAVFGGAAPVLPAGATALPMHAAGGVPGAPMVPNGPGGFVPPAVGAGVPTASGMPATPQTPTPPVYVAPNPAIMGAPGAPGVPMAAMPALPGVPGVPQAPQAPQAPAAWPPAGWTAHPTSPGYYHNGVEAIDEATLRARTAAPVAPQAPAAPMAPAAPIAPPAGPQMTAAANGVPYASFIANGWTDATLRTNGLMV
jgi:hypothetical protein